VVRVGGEPLAVRARPECLPCLERLIRRTADLAAGTPELRARAAAAGLEVVRREFAPEVVPARVAAAAQRAVRSFTGNPDPFLPVKRREMAVAAALAARLRGRYDRGLLPLVALAALGNSLDFFRDLSLVEREVEEGVEFVIDHIDVLARKLAGCRRIVYLADNAGECHFDLPLLSFLRRRAAVVYAVKEGPVQNDLTRGDLEREGLLGLFEPVVTTGTDSPGLDWERASASFKEELAAGDLIIAKGMGYYETLPALPLGRPVFYLMKAKCGPVAEDIGVPLGAYVAMMKEQ